MPNHSMTPNQRTGYIRQTTYLFCPNLDLGNRISGQKQIQERLKPSVLLPIILLPKQVHVGDCNHSKEVVHIRFIPGTYLVLEIVYQLLETTYLFLTWSLHDPEKKRSTSKLDPKQIDAKRTAKWNLEVTSIYKTHFIDHSTKKKSCMNVSNTWNLAVNTSIFANTNW